MLRGNIKLAGGAPPIIVDLDPGVNKLQQGFRLKGLNPKTCSDGLWRCRLACQCLELHSKQWQAVS